MDLGWKIISAVVGSTALSSLIIFLITRHDNKKRFEEKLRLLEKDGLRTQMLVLILLRPQDHNEILTLAEKYFAKLHGNWIMTPIFNRWCIEQDVAEPDWFNRDARGDE